MPGFTAAGFKCLQKSRSDCKTFFRHLKIYAMKLNVEIGHENYSAVYPGFIFFKIGSTIVIFVVIKL
jgi:hypothetical protein